MEALVIRGSSGAVVIIHDQVKKGGSSGRSRFRETDKVTHETKFNQCEQVVFTIGCDLLEVEASLIENLRRQRVWSIPFGGSATAAGPCGAKPVTSLEAKRKSTAIQDRREAAQRVLSLRKPLPLNFV